jgi:hypothetical protein
MPNQISKVRRGDDKKKVTAAISEMVDDERAALDDLMQMDADLFGDGVEDHLMDWEDFSEHDFDPLPEDDYCEDDYIDPFEDEEYFDPWMEMDYDYMY